MLSVNGDEKNGGEWFDANMMPEGNDGKGYEDSRGASLTNLFIGFASNSKMQNGMQFQPKHWKSNDYAVYSKTHLTGGKPVVFTSVLFPHSSKNAVNDVAKNIKESGLSIQVLEDGMSRVIINSQSLIWAYPHMTIEIGSGEKWNVFRGK